MKTLDEVIKDLEKCMTDDAIESEGFYLASDSLFYLKEYRWIVENCADALAEKYPSENVPLTWDELREMEGEPVWLESHGDITEYTGWAIVKNIKPDDRVNFILSRCEDDRFCALEIGVLKALIGRDWQAYRK